MALVVLMSHTALELASIYQYMGNVVQRKTTVWMHSQESIID